MERVRVTVASAIVILVLAVLGTPGASAAPSVKKAIWGPAQVNGKSQFPIYGDLGVGIYQWRLVGATWLPLAPRTRRIPPIRRSDGPQSSATRSERQSGTALASRFR